MARVEALVCDQIRTTEIIGEARVGWQGTLSEAIERAMPHVDVGKWMGLNEDLLVFGLKNCWETAIIRGSVAKNLVHPSKIGAKTQEGVLCFLGKIDSGYWRDHLVWEKTYFDIKKGMDIDVRFLFRDGGREIWESMLEKRFGRNVQDNDRPRQFLETHRLSEFNNNKSGRKIWDVVTGAINADESQQVYLSLAEVAGGYETVSDRRSGLSATVRDVEVKADLRLKENEAVVELDEVAIMAFRKPDRPILVLTDHLTTSMRTLVNGRLWPPGLVDFRALLVAVSSGATIPEVLIPEFQKYCMFYCESNLAGFILVGRGLGMFGALRLGEYLNKHGVTYNKLLQACGLDSVESVDGLYFSSLVQIASCLRSPNGVVVDFNEIKLMSGKEVEPVGGLEKFYKGLKKLGIIGYFNAKEVLLNLLTPVSVKVEDRAFLSEFAYDPGL